MSFGITRLTRTPGMDAAAWCRWNCPDIMYVRVCVRAWHTALIKIVLAPFSFSGQDSIAKGPRRVDFTETAIGCFGRFLRGEETQLEDSWCIGLYMVHSLGLVHICKRQFVYIPNRQASIYIACKIWSDVGRPFFKANGCRGWQLGWSNVRRRIFPESPTRLACATVLSLQDNWMKVTSLTTTGLALIPSTQSSCSLCHCTSMKLAKKTAMRFSFVTSSTFNCDEMWNV